MEPLQLLLVSAALQAAGSVLQKQRVASRVPGATLGQVTRRLGTFFGPLFRDPGWIAGGLLGLAGAVFGLQALASMDLSVLKTLGRVETVFVVVAGVVFLGERLRAAETLGVALLVAGALLLAVRAAETSGVATTRETHLLLVAGVVGLLGLIGLAQRRSSGGPPPELALAGAAGFLFGTGDILTKGATEVVKSSASDGGFHVAEAASLGSLVTTPEFGLALAAYVGGGVLIQTAFSVGRVSVIGPATLIGSMLLPIVFALAVLGEELNGDRLTGICVIAAGTLLLGRGPGKSCAGPGSQGEVRRRGLVRFGGRLG